MSGIREVLHSFGFKFNKKYGQNFISDKNLLRAIAADSGVAGGDVLEIGAGAGTLTAELSRICKSVTAYEIDACLIPVLHSVLSDCDNVTVINADIMQVDTAKIDAMFADGYHIVANLPYYITTPVILKFIENSAKLQSMTVMVQKEVAQRLTASPGSKEYGSITVAVDFAGGARITRIVPRTLFYPVPGVDSAVVRIDIDRQKIPVYDKKMFVSVYRQAFAMRRKTLYNNLSGLIADKALLTEAIASLGMGTDVRGEKLSAKDFAKLADILNSSGKKCF